VLPRKSIYLVAPVAAVQINVSLEPVNVLPGAGEVMAAGVIADDVADPFTETDWVALLEFIALSVRATDSESTPGDVVFSGEKSMDSVQVWPEATGLEGEQSVAGAEGSSGKSAG
jgi:hypothetical protein